MRIDRAYSSFKLKSLDTGSGEFEGIASTPSTDRMEDVVEPRGANFTLPIPLLWQHKASEPIGLITSARVTDAGITVKGKIEKDLTPRITEAWALIKAGLVRGLSIGFDPKEWTEIKGTFGLRFTKWDWLELSAVTIAANAEANITTIKSADSAHLRAALGHRKSGSEDADSNRAGATAQKSKGTKVKTFEQRMSDLQEQRKKHAARMAELMEGAGGEIETLDAAEVKEYDELCTQVSSIDTDFRRLKAHQTAVSGATEIPVSAGTDRENGSRVRRGVDVKSGEIKLEKGIAFAQYAKFLGRAKGNPMHALAMAQSAHGVDPRVPRILKTAVEAGSVSGSGSAGNWGMELVGEEGSAFADFIDFLRPMTILGKFGTNGIPSLRKVPFRIPLIGMTDGGTGYWVGEGKAKPLTKFAFSRTHLDPLKVATMCAVSRELIMDSSPAADGLIRDALAAALREREDTDFIDPSKGAVSGVSPASITNGISATGTSGTSAANVRTDIKAAFDAFIADNNAPTSGVWIMPSTIALSLSLMMNSLGQPEFPNVTMNGGTLAGLPVITSEYVTAGYVWLVNAQDIYYGDDGDVVIDTSEHASLEMNTAPSHDSTTPTASSALVSMFQTNSVAYRAERRIDWMRRRDSAVAGISGVAWA